MNEELRRRLRELGVMKGVRTLALASRTPRPRLAIEDLVEGTFHTTSQGRCFVAERHFPFAHQHGTIPLSAFLDLSWTSVEQMTGDIGPGEEKPDLHRSVFVDTETTGLAGGTGTLAFVVGLAFFDTDGFHIHQYFLRDLGDEPAMIARLAEELPAFELLVSFNGRAFDVPILETRFILNRRPFPMSMRPHLDLLPPARRLWRHHLPSCSLMSIEEEVLGVRRDQADVPGYLIPSLYRDYLRTGDARDMQRVLYHNAVDILSLVALAVRIGQTVGDPDGWQDAALSGAELYGLGRWYQARSRPELGERAWRAALHADLSPPLRARTLHDLALLLKRAGRRDEAFAYWQQLALESTDDVTAHVELAKYFEWHVGNLALAAHWTQAGIALAERWYDGERRAVTLAGLRHRLKRLQRKERRERKNGR